MNKDYEKAVKPQYEERKETGSAKKTEETSKKEVRHEERKSK